MTIPSQLKWPRRAVIVVAIFGGLFAAVSAFTSRAPTGPPAALAFDELLIEHPDAVIAGEPFTVRVSSSAPSPIVGEVQLVLEASYGPRSFLSTSVDGVAEFVIRPTSDPVSGLLVLEAHANGQRGQSLMDIVPGDPVGPLPVFLGPRTIEVGTDQVAMLVAIPVDAFGNPTEPGTELDALITRPGGDQETLSTTTERLLGYLEIDSQNWAGRTTVSAVADGVANGPARTFEEVASTALAFDIELLDPIPVADGRSLFRVRTATLTDRFGNVLPDGTSGTLEISGVTHRRRLSSHTIDGQLIFVVEAPERPGAAELQVFASGAQSAPMTIDFASAIERASAEVLIDGPFTRVLVGPVIGPDGGLVPDGTEVRAIADGEVFIEYLEHGRAELVFSSLGEIELSVLGTTLKPEVPR